MMSFQVIFWFHSLERDDYQYLEQIGCFYLLTHAGRVVIYWSRQNPQFIIDRRNVLITKTLTTMATPCRCTFVNYSTSCASSMKHFNFEHFVIYSMLYVMAGAHAVRFIDWTVRELVRDLKRYKNQK